MGLLSNPESREKLSKLISRYDNKLCFICYIVGVVWFLLLAHTELNARTYFSENALLPGLVESEFYNSHAVSDYLRELKDEVTKRKSSENLRLKIPVEWLIRKFTDVGLDTYVQNYTFHYPHGILKGQVFTGRNVYGILRAPRISGTEALVLAAPFRPEPFSENTLAGIALMIGLAEDFRKHTYWAKDIIFIVSEDDEIGMQAWLSAYHHTYNEYILPGELVARSGSIQAAVNMEIATDAITRFDVRIEGLNGQLPNLDLVNTVVRMCKRENIAPTLQKRADYWSLDSVDGFLYSLKTMLLSMSQLATGSPSGNHGLFHRYNIEAVTLHSIKLKGTRLLFGFNEMGHVVEGIFRSLNNLLERFHQSFFFYLLPSVERYASIGVYMPPFGILALPVIIKAVSLWLTCGILAVASSSEKESELVNAAKCQASEAVKDDVKEQRTTDESAAGKLAVQPVKGKADTKQLEASKSLGALFAYIPFFLMSSFFGLCAYYGPQYFVDFSGKMHLDADTGLTIGLVAVHVAIIGSPLIVHRKLIPVRSNTARVMSGEKPDARLLKSIALLCFGMLLGSTTIINVSLAFFVATLTVPVVLLIAPTSNRLLHFIQLIFLCITSPLGFVCIASAINVLVVQKPVTSVPLWDLIWKNVETGVLSSVVQQDMLNNWTYGLVTLAYLPTWVMFWQIIFCEPAYN